MSTSFDKYIFKTLDLSRDYDKMIDSWPLSYVKQKMELAQFGGIKGNSITLTLIFHYHFIASNAYNLAKDKKIHFGRLNLQVKMFPENFS